AALGGGVWGGGRKRRRGPCPAARPLTPTLPKPKPHIRGLRPLDKATETGNSRFRLGGGSRCGSATAYGLASGHAGDPMDMDQTMIVAGVGWRKRARGGGIEGAGGGGVAPPGGAATEGSPPPTPAPPRGGAAHGAAARSTHR